MNHGAPKVQVVVWLLSHDNLEVACFGDGAVWVIPLVIVCSPIVQIDRFPVTHNPKRKHRVSVCASRPIPRPPPAPG